MTNFTSDVKFISKGTKIAQIIAMPAIDVKYEKTDKVAPNPKHEGFGSTS